MLDRVSTLSHSTVLLNEYQRIQSRMVETQAQISSGKVGDTYADVDGKAGVLASAKSQAARSDTWASTAREVESRLSLQDTQMQQLGELADSFREALGNAVATGRAEGLMETARGLYQSAVSILNSKVDGVHIYGGTRSDVAPVSADDLEALRLAPTVADVFENSPLPQTQAIDDGVSLETGQLASDLGTNFFQMLKDLASFDAGANGPFGSTLTQAQTTFLQGQMVAVPAVSADIHTALAENGVRYNQVQDVIARHEDTKSELTKFIGNIEDVDLAAAITRLNQDQVAQQAAARMIAQLQEITLLNVLR